MTICMDPNLPDLQLRLLCFTPFLLQGFLHKGWFRATWLLSYNTKTNGHFQGQKSTTVFQTSCKLNMERKESNFSYLPTGCAGI
jgi:hypothetical protein